MAGLFIVQHGRILIYVQNAVRVMSYYETFYHKKKKKSCELHVS